MKLKDKTKENTVFLTILKRKGLVIFATLGLLVSLIVMGTAAWYTRINKVTGITLDVAQYDFNANYTNKEFILNTANYFANEERLCAPGTIGVIPIKVSNSGATAVDYTLAVNKSSMADEFKRRIRFFYYDAETGNPVTLDDNSTIEGTLGTEDGTEKMEYIYWEWVYELSNDLYYDFINGKWCSNGVAINGGTCLSLYDLYVINDCTYMSHAAFTTVAEAQTAHDEFDTKVGMQELNEVFTSASIRNPQAYQCQYDVTASSITFNDDGTQEETSEYTTSITAIQKAMESTITITGAQAKPSAMTSAAMEAGTTTFVAIETIHSGATH